MNTIENTLVCERLYIRKDSFGRIVLDTCPTDAHHLQHSETDPVENRPKCRMLAEEMFNEAVGKQGWLEVEVRFQPCDPEAEMNYEAIDDDDDDDEPLDLSPECNGDVHQPYCRQYTAPVSHPAVDDVYMGPTGKKYTVVEIGQRTGRVYIAENGGEDFRDEMPHTFSDTNDTFFTRVRV